MAYQQDGTPSAEIEFRILLAVAQELAKLADEAMERARAAEARIPRPKPPLLDIMGGE